MLISWIGSRSLRHLAQCVTCCGRTLWKTLVQRSQVKSTSITTLSEDAPTTTGTELHVANTHTHTHTFFFFFFFFYFFCYQCFLHVILFLSWSAYICMYILMYTYMYTVHVCTYVSWATLCPDYVSI